MLPVLLIAIFCAFTAAFSIAVLVWVRQQRRKQVLDTLRLEPSGAGPAATTILRPEPVEWSSVCKDLVFFLRLRDVVSKLLRQADVDWTPAKFFSLSALLTLSGAALGLLLWESVPGLFVLTGAAGAALPLLYVRHSRSRRVRRIEEQFPDALDFLSRAMRAGHAFSVSLEMLADETPDPTGSEFRKLYHEQNLGAPIEVALQAFAERCALLDVQFFVSAVRLQKETGGNLTEILGRLAFTIRERLRLKGQVRAASAHGRVTGLILTAMPMILMLGLMAITPGYLTGLTTDPHGRYLIVGAMAGQFIGYLCIRSITNIRV